MNSHDGFVKSMELTAEQHRRKESRDGKTRQFGNNPTVMGDGVGADFHALSQTLRKVSGHLLSVSLPLQDAFKRANLYSKPQSGSTVLLIYEKNVLGRRIIHQPLFAMNSLKAGKLATGLNIASKGIGAIGVVFALKDITAKGFTISNSLDLTMSGLALSGIGSGIAGSYFLLNAGSMIFTKKDIGQHIDEFIK